MGSLKTELEKVAEFLSLFFSITKWTINKGTLCLGLEYDNAAG